MKARTPLELELHVLIEPAYYQLGHPRMISEHGTTASPGHFADALSARQGSGHHARGARDARPPPGISGPAPRKRPQARFRRVPQGRRPGQSSTGCGHSFLPDLNVNRPRLQPRVGRRDRDQDIAGDERQATHQEASWGPHRSRSRASISSHERRWHPWAILRCRISHNCRPSAVRGVNMPFSSTRGDSCSCFPIPASDSPLAERRRPGFSVLAPGWRSDSYGSLPSASGEKKCTAGSCQLSLHRQQIGERIPP
jgi:hypothetical protein